MFIFILSLAFAGSVAPMAPLETHSFGGVTFTETAKTGLVAAVGDALCIQVKGSKMLPLLDSMLENVSSEYRYPTQKVGFNCTLNGSTTADGFLCINLTYTRYYGSAGTLTDSGSACMSETKFTEMREYLASTY